MSEHTIGKAESFGQPWVSPARPELNSHAGATVDITRELANLRSALTAAQAERDAAVQREQEAVALAAALREDLGTAASTFHHTVHGKHLMPGETARQHYESCDAVNCTGWRAAIATPNAAVDEMLAAAAIGGRVKGLSREELAPDAPDAPSYVQGAPGEYGWVMGWGAGWKAAIKAALTEGGKA